MNLPLLHASLFLVLILSSCSSLETVKNETTEAVDNLENEAAEVTGAIGDTIDQMNSIVDSVESTKKSVENTVDGIKNITEGQ